MTADRALSESHQRLVDSVEQHGCQILFVFDADGDDPDFAYSVGFRKTVGQPEVIIFGLKKELMHSMINGLLEQCRNGLQLVENGLIDDLIEGFQCVAKKVHPSQIEEGYFNSSMWFHNLEFGGELTEVFQIVWPGAQDGKFPWDEGCSNYVQDVQTALYKPRLTA